MNKNNRVYIKTTFSEEEADEIVRCLSRPPRGFYSMRWSAPTSYIVDILPEELSQSIARVRDKELLSKISKEI